MARARNIKPAIMDNDDLAELAPLTRLLFVYLWMLADREGRLEDRPKRIAAQALPFDRNVDAGAMLAAQFLQLSADRGDVAIDGVLDAKAAEPADLAGADDAPHLADRRVEAVDALVREAAVAALGQDRRS